MEQPHQPEEPKPKKGKLVFFYSLLFFVAGLLAFEAVAPRLYPQPAGGGFNYQRMIVAGAVGALCAAVGGAVGRIIERRRG